MDYRHSFIFDGNGCYTDKPNVNFNIVPIAGTGLRNSRVAGGVTDSQLLAQIESHVSLDAFPSDEPTTWCTCDDCLCLDWRLRGSTPCELVCEPLLLLFLSPSVLTRQALVHCLPALMIVSMSHQFGSDELRRGLALELVTQAGVIESFDSAFRETIVEFLRWAARVEENQGLFADDYFNAANQLETTGTLERQPSFAVTW